MGNVIRSPQARADLKNIARYIARESCSLDIALRFLDKVEQRAALYATQPEMGKPRPELAEGIRSFPLGEFLVFYRPRGDGLELVRVIRGSRDIARQF